ncbi:MAG: fumarate hydratase class II [Gammaproteobacteria bacterium]|jgi:fumarate hydratase class II
MKEVGTRIETDSMGDVAVPLDALYGAQTQRALNNFNISDFCLPTSFIVALAQIKKAAAQTNADLKLLSPEAADAITRAADEILQGKHSDQFPVDVFQTGSGTSSNMNINEVIVGICRERFGLTLHPNDQVNLGQSSNDVIPTAVQVSSLLQLHNQLIPAFNQLIEVVDAKSDELKSVIKTGRTHLMDAMPLTFGQELSGWASQLRIGIDRLEEYMISMAALPQGGTAVGTGVNTHPSFASDFAAKLSANLSETLGIEFGPSDNFFRSISSQDLSVGLSGNLRVLATSLFKISNDLRWMNSGPLCGLAEIELEALQPGSSIMPGKVNPVVPEAVSMACAQVVGNDATVLMAGMSGNFQLNTMLPVIAYNLLQSIELLGNSANHLGQHCIRNFVVNTGNIKAAVQRNPILATALAPSIGYTAAAEIAKKAYRTKRPILEVACEETDIDEQVLRELLEPLNLANLPDSTD